MQFVFIFFSLFILPQALMGCLNSSKRLDQTEARLTFLENRLNSLKRLDETEARLTYLENRLEKEAQAESEAKVYRAYKTKNNWTYLLLNTQDGRVWQTHFSVDNHYRGKVPINPLPLDWSGKPGQFELEPTENMWNFIMLDKNSGRMWQIQYSMDSLQGIFPIR